MCLDIVNVLSHIINSLIVVHNLFVSRLPISNNNITL